MFNTHPFGNFPEAIFQSGRFFTKTKEMSTIPHGNTLGDNCCVEKDDRHGPPTPKADRFWSGKEHFKKTPLHCC